MCFVAARHGESFLRRDRVGKMLEFCALGGKLGKRDGLGFAMCIQIRAVDEAHAHLPRRQVLDVAHLDPALFAEYLHAPRFGRCDERAEVAGRAALEAEQHGRRIVDPVIEHAAQALCVHRVDFSRQEQHCIDDMHAAPRHAARGTFFRIEAPVVRPEPVNAGAAKIAFDVQQLAQAAVGEHALDFLQRRLKPPVEADRERYFVVGAGLDDGIAVALVQRQRLFREDMLAGLRSGGDDFDALRVWRSDDDRVDLRIGEHFFIRIV